MLSVLIAFKRLLRYDGVTQVNVLFIYWMGRRGLALKLGTRKNDQHNMQEWLLLPGSGRARGVAQMLREFCIDTNPDLIFPGPDKYGFAKGLKAGADRFVFRKFGLVDGHTKKGYRRWEMKSDGSSPISLEVTRDTYRRYLRRSRVMLRECCGLDEADAALFSLQSWRRSGATALLEAGATVEQRMAMGGWKTFKVQEGYLDRMMDDELDAQKNKAGEFIIPL